MTTGFHGIVGVVWAGALAACLSQARTCAANDGDDRLAAAAAADYARPVRPGGIDGRSFWNGYSVRFLYPPAFGFAAVDGRYSALIPKNEAQGDWRIGEVVEARVTGVLPDGRLNLSVREKAYLQLEKDAELVLKVIGEYEGVLPFDDKVPPEMIRREFSLSKNAFKRAVGHLLKEGKVEIRGRRIYRI